MTALIDPALDILQAAGDLAGVPYLSTAISLTKGIKDNCERIQAHKDDCQRLAQKAAQLTDVFEEQMPKLRDSELRKYADEVEGALAKVHGRTSRWANYGAFHAFFRDARIADGIKQCNTDLDIAIASFHLNAAVVLNHNQEELKLMVRNNQENLDQIMIILRNPSDIRQLAALQEAGEAVVEPVMNAGKMQLKVLREKTGDPFKPVDDEVYQQTQRGMSQLYSMTGIPPTVRKLDGEITRPDDLPYVGGVYSDIWIGYWLGDQKVALKTMRGVVISTEKAQKRFEREINVWAKLSHPHVLTFLGIVTDLGHFTHMVSPWQKNGNILDYIKKFEKADRLHLLSGAADGLAYLHSQGVIHGNVRCANILVGIGGEAIICDFGMSKVREEINAQSATMTLTTQGSARWMSPELLEAIITSPTQECDVYSFSMTMLECFTLEHPFIEIKREIHVITKMSRGPLVPVRPTSESSIKWITDEVWALMVECWSRDPKNRLKMRGVADRMNEIEMNVRRSTFSPTPSFQMPTPSTLTPTTLSESS